MTNSDADARLAGVIAAARDEDALRGLPGEDMWPAIRERIEREKVVALPGAHGPWIMRGIGTRRWLAWVGAATAAGVALFVLGRESGRFRGTPASAGAGLPAVASVADSADAYQRDARILFDRLSMQRSMLRPEAMRSIDRDLRVVDAAIAELDAAVVRDPHDPVLRQLLASSYRQKVDVLKRAGNAE